MALGKTPLVIQTGHSEIAQEVVRIEIDAAGECSIVLHFEARQDRPISVSAPITRDAIKGLAANIPEIVERLDSA